MRAEPGLRERKKQQTREAIATAAFDLFSERGFDSVRVAEVARKANVSEATVFNYFPTKEDLIYSRWRAFETGLLEAVRERDRQQSILDAFRGFLRGQQGLLGSRDPGDAEKLLSITRIITGSPSLLARERMIHDEYTRSLARLIAEEASAEPDDLEPWIVANALVGVQRALLDFTRTNVLAGKAGLQLARRVRAEAERAFALLDRGLGGYPGRPSS
jgi:AcrR family transcriptional regulator